MSARNGKLPGWVDYGLIPLLNLTAALLVSGLVVLLIDATHWKRSIIWSMAHW